MMGLSTSKSTQSFDNLMDLIGKTAECVENSTVIILSLIVIFFYRYLTLLY